MMRSAFSVASSSVMGTPSYGMRVEELAFSIGCGLPTNWAKPRTGEVSHG